MCRFALYLGPPAPLGAVLTDPAHSLLEQSRHSEQGLERVNGDGCGVAWYPAGDSQSPQVVHDAAPAWDSTVWDDLATSQHGHCILGHVRAATEGLAVTQENCHPFVWRRLAFMHNGKLPGFARMQPALLDALSARARGRLAGTTDSEHALALFTDHWLALEGAAPLDRLEGALRLTLATLESLRRDCGIDGHGSLNIAVSDGRRAVVSRCASPEHVRAHSLYVRRSSATPFPNARSVIVASEPLDHGAGWDLVPDRSVVRVDVDLRVVITPLRSGTSERAA